MTAGAGAGAGTEAGEGGGRGAGGSSAGFGAGVDAVAGGGGGFRAVLAAGGGTSASFAGTAADGATACSCFSASSSLWRRENAEPVRTRSIHLEHIRTYESTSTKLLGKAPVTPLSSPSHQASSSCFVTLTISPVFSVSSSSLSLS